MTSETNKSEHELSLLIYTLEQSQRFGINLAKVREVAPCPPVIRLAETTPPLRGICRLRDETIPVIDTKEALQRGATENMRLIMVCRFARHTVGFLIDEVHDILELSWSSIQAPPAETRNHQLLTGVISIDSDVIQLPDVELLLARLTPQDELAPPLTKIQAKILIVDDSLVARKQIERTLIPMGAECTSAADGIEALKILQSPGTNFDALIVDVEMPRMDGYNLVRQLRSSTDFADIPIILHSSLEGEANEERGITAGADNVLTKFDATMLAGNLEQILKLKRNGNTGND